MKNDINIHLLDRFMRGETSHEEDQLLLTWFRNSEAREEILQFYRQRWQESEEGVLTDEIQERMFCRIKERMHALNLSEKSTQKVHKVQLRRWLRYVAAAILLLSVGVASHLYTRQSMTVENSYVVEADKGQRASITLPDGTKVWLNSHTQLSYAADYGIKDRVVSLDGEAYFEVAKDKKRRFLVKTDGIDVEALGTSFNVKAYNEDGKIAATLFTGSVRISTGTETILLAPRQQVQFDKQNRTLLVVGQEYAEYADMWLNNELAFKGETLDNIALLLNRMYNVQIEFESEKIRQYRFSGVIKNNSLENVIEIISLTAQIEYKLRGDTIRLGEKQNRLK